METILIDAGSSTVKVYRHAGEKPEMILQKSISFKSGFDSEKGISATAKKELFDLMNSINKNNPHTKIKIFATGIFRKLSPAAKISFVDEFFLETGALFNIIGQELENFYLQMALLGKANLSEPALLINIGGGSTELAVVSSGKVLERKNIDLGVGSINEKFPKINSEISDAKPSSVIEFVKNLLPNLETTPRVAFYTGGELNYMQLAGYALKKNFLFEDADHPLTISFENFSKRNVEVFSKIKLSELEALVPEDPKWMHGARGCSAIAQAICEKYGVQIIVPSNSNLIDGAARQEFRSVTISGSFRKHLERIAELKKYFESYGIEVLSPKNLKAKNPGEEFVVFDGSEKMSALQLEREHLVAIEKADALIVCNPAGYVGASALMEIGFAHAHGKKIIFLEKPEEFLLNKMPAKIGL